MGRCVTIAADDSHAWQRQTLLRPYDVHNALTRVAHRVQPDPELFAVRSENFDLFFTDFISNRQMNVLGGNIVVFGCDGQIGSPNSTTIHP